MNAFGAKNHTWTTSQRRQHHQQQRILHKRRENHPKNGSNQNRVHNIVEDHTTHAESILVARTITDRLLVVETTSDGPTTDVRSTTYDAGQLSG
jgi:5-deoxy-D-glucuronate isomerase